MWSIIQLELVILWRSSALRLGLPAILVLMIAASVNGRVVQLQWERIAEQVEQDVNSYRVDAVNQLEAYEAGRWVRRVDLLPDLNEGERLALMQAHLIETSENDSPEISNLPWAAWYFQTYALKQPTALSGLATGQSDLLSSYYKVRASEDFQHAAVPELRNPLNMATGGFDLAFVVVFLVPIFILSLCFDVLSGEKERGTLVLALSQPVSLPTLLLGKLLARLAIVLPMLLLSGIVCAAVIGASLFSSDSWLDFGMWSLIVTGYCLFWLGAAVLINASGRSSARNGTAVAIVWVSVVMILPAFGNLVLEQFLPPPARSTIDIEAREATEFASEDTGQVIDGFLDAYAVVNPTDAGPDRDDFWTYHYAKQHYINESLRPLVQEFTSHRQEQLRWLDFVQAISPALATFRALGVVSGNGDMAFLEFENQVRDFRREYVDYFMSPLVKGRTSFNSAMASEAPRFEFLARRKTVVAGEVVVAVFGMVCLGLALGVAGLRRAGRYAVVG